MSISGEESLYFSCHEFMPSLLQRAESALFWTELNPELSISDSVFSKPFESYDVPDLDLPNLQESLVQDGYFRTRSIVATTVCATLANSILTLADHSCHPLFAMVYDQFWSVLQGLCSLVGRIVGKSYRIRPDFWVWCVSPSHARSGWSPHRDLQIIPPFLSDGTPSVVTLWISLTDADPSNGCIYILPKSLDRNLPCHPEIVSVERVQDVCALPAKAGSVLAWDQHLIHWGGRANRYCTEPRISFSSYFQAEDFHSDVELIDVSEPLSLQARLAYISQAFLRYKKSFDFPEPLLKFAAKANARYQFSKISVSDLKKLFQG